MIRTIISLNDDEKEWLDQVAKNQRISMAKVIREAIREYRNNHAILSQSKFEKLLEKTRGIWVLEDGLKYQTRIRNEWDEKE